VEGLVMTLIRGVLGLLLMVAACNRPSTDSHTAATATVPESESNLSIEKAQALLKPDAQGQLAVQLIDVRTQSEWATGYIPGAKHIPLDEIPTKLDAIDKSRTIVLYCAAGGRSHRALEILKAAGYRDVRHLAPGISGWKAAGLAIAK